MSLFEDWHEWDELSGEVPDRSRNPVSYPVRHHIFWFRRIFPNQHYRNFFQQLQSIVKRRLTLSERDEIVIAGYNLLWEKQYVESAEDFRSEFKSEAERENRVLSEFKKYKSHAEKLLKLVKRPRGLTLRPLLEEEGEFYQVLYAPLNNERSEAPIEAVLERIVAASEYAIAKPKPKHKPGPPPDEPLRCFIRKLALVFGQATAGYSERKGCRSSPFIDFVQKILFALPEPAIIGNNGSYFPAAIEAHVAERWLHKFGRRGKWNFCLTAGTLVLANQERR